MNTFRTPFIFVVCFVIVGHIIVGFGFINNRFDLIYFGGAISGVGLGIALVNAYPLLFLDKHSTDEEWEKKHE